jgi:hypothetical protein
MYSQDSSCSTRLFSSWLTIASASVSCPISNLINRALVEFRSLTNPEETFKLSLLKSMPYTEVCDANLLTLVVAADLSLDRYAVGVPQCIISFMWD